MDKIDSTGAPDGASVTETATTNHIVNDGSPETWNAIEDAIGSFHKGWPGPPSRSLDPDRLPLVYTTSTGDPARDTGWETFNIDDI